MQELYKNIFWGEVILPKSPLKALNLYLIRSDDYTLLIDSGFDTPQSEESFFALLEEADVQKGKVDMYLTHLHADHSGLAYKFQQKYGGKVFCSQKDAEYILAMTEQDYFDKRLYPPEFLGLENDGHFFDTHPAVLYCAKQKIDFTIVAQGETIPVGEYHFEVISLPGHTPALTGLYERTHRLLFCGDHILDKITPNISFWQFEDGDILGVYLQHLDKVANMDVDIVFASHRSILYDPKRRIDELKSHHEQRLKDILNLLDNGEPQNVAQIASRMHWDFRAKDFDDFPPPQKWFACGEAMAHLEHLVALGKVIRIEPMLPTVRYQKISE